jgi:hypothetical protein
VDVDDLRHGSPRVGLVGLQWSSVSVARVDDGCASRESDARGFQAGYRGHDGKACIHR